MKIRNTLPLSLSLCVTLAVSAIPEGAAAAEILWDLSTEAGIQGGAGTWSTTAAHWTLDGGVSNVAWSNPANASDTAVFSAGGGIVAVDGPISLAGLHVTSTAAASTIGGRSVGYLFNGGALQFGSQRGSIDNTVAQTTVQINNDLSGTGGLTVASTGGETGASPWIVLNGDNTGLSGGIAVTSGLLAFTSQDAAGTNAIALQGGGIFGPVTHSGDGTASVAPGTSLTLANDLSIAGTGNLLRAWGGRILELSGTLTGDGEALKADGGTLRLSGNAAAYSGTLVNTAGATVIAGPFGGTLGVPAGTVTLDDPFSGTLRVSGGSAVSNDAFSGSLLLEAGAFTVNDSFAGTLAFEGGALHLLGSTFTGDISYGEGEVASALTIGPSTTVVGNVSANYGASALTVSGTIDGNLFWDEGVTSILSGATITGNVTAGDPEFSPELTLQQTNGPITVGGTLTVNGTLEISLDGSVADGEPFLTYSQLVTDTPNTGNHIKILGLDLLRNGQTTITSGGISVTSSPGSVLWTGLNSNVWEAAGEANWTLNGSPSAFYNGDSVTFPYDPPDPDNTSIALQGPIETGDMTVDHDSDLVYSFSGSGIGGGGSFTKSGTGATRFSQDAGNSFPGGFEIQEGSISILTNQQATGTGPLTLSPNTVLDSFPATSTATVSYANAAIELEEAAWNFPGSSSGTVTHTYSFTGLPGSAEETDPATAIQITDGTLTLHSTNGTTKAFNGRIRWSGDNTINRTSTAYTHVTNWNRAWYGDGTVTINKTGGATARTMNFNGAGSTFSGTLVLGATAATGGNDPTFHLNQALPASAIEVRNRWNLNNAAPEGLDGVGAITLFDAASRLTLSQPVNNPALDLDLQAGTLVLANAANTIGTLTTANATILSGGENSSLTISSPSSGDGFAGTIALGAGGSLAAGSSSIHIGTQTVGELTQSSGALRVGFDATGANIATISGAYTHTGGTIVVEVSSLPQLGVSYTVLNFGSLTGTPTVQVTGLEGSDFSFTVGYTDHSITLTFSGSAQTLTWTGAANANWDETSQNWTAGGSPASYTQFDTAVFNDSATGSTEIVLGGTVTPGAVIFDHSELAYFVSGTGSIAGGTTLTKDGTGITTLSTANTYTGGSSLNAGLVLAGSDTALGSGTITFQGGALAGILASEEESQRALANPLHLASSATIGGASSTANVVLSGTISGEGSLSKIGSNTLTLSPGQENSFTGGVTVSEGILAVGSNQPATGTGPLVLEPGSGFQSFPLASTASAAQQNSSITVNGATWGLPGSSGGSVTHTYEFTGSAGSADETDPATAIQITDGTLTLHSTNTTTKAFNGRIRWSGDNTINRTSTAYTHTTNWNRAWYGDGTVTINKTGAATGRSMNFNGAGSTFSGTLVLGATEETGGNNPTFHLNQPLPASAVEIRNRWNFNHNVADGLAGATSLSVVDAESQLTLTQPLQLSQASLVIGEGTLDVGTGNSTVGSLIVHGVEQPSGVYTAENSSFITGTGSLTVLGGESGGGYADWLGSFGLTAGAAGTGALESFDDSGVANIVQFALGGDPTDPANNGLWASFTEDADGGDGLILTLAVRAGASFSGSPSPTASIDGIAVAIQGSTDLSTWTSPVVEITPVRSGNLIAPAGYLLKSFRLEETLPLQSKGFLRVEVLPTATAE